MIMMMARKAFVINSMIVMPIPSQNKINPKSRFIAPPPPFCFAACHKLILFYADDV